MRSGLIPQRKERLAFMSKKLIMIAISKFTDNIKLGEKLSVGL